MLDRRGKSAEADPDDEPMDMIEFIRKVDKKDVFPGTGSGSPTAAASSPITRKVSAPSFGALNGGSYQREELGSPAGAQPPFATGSPTSVQRKPLPSFRMKAFKNQRQTTFHSLDMHTDRTAEAQIAGSSLCQSNSSGLVEQGDDILRMPCIESMRISERPVPLNGKTYQKINSESAMHALKKKIQSVSNSGSKTDLNAQPTTKRVLHTVRQPDGSVVGFCTEEPIVDPETAATEPTGK